MASWNRSGYDEVVAVDDEARVRATLVEMQHRISKGPHNALGVTHTATHGEVRTAFLQLTKQFHPARFARMSVDLQKFSNEIFLGLRSAHDTLVSGSSLRASAANKSGGFPTVQAEGTGGTRQATTAAMQPIQRPPATRATGTLPVTSRPSTPQAAPTAKLPVTSRTPTPSSLPKPPPRPSGAVEAINPQTLRYGEQQKPPAAAPATTPVFDERTALEQAFELISAKNWPAARQALHSLAARVPQSKQYRALLCYTRGREAQAANRPDEALLEFQRALQLDPELNYAKQALAELQRRR
jgi:curved DNA-binding protein CbpA